MKKYILSSILFITLVILTYFFVLRGCDFNLLVASFRNTNSLFVFLTFLCMVGYVFIGSFFLKRILHHFKYNVKFFDALGFMFTEVYFSSITPSYIGGQPIQMLEMKKDNVPYEVSSVVVLFNSMMNRIALLIVATILFIFYGGTVLTLNTFYQVLVCLGYGTAIFVSFFFAGAIYSKKMSNLFLKIANFLIDHIKFIKNKEELKEKLSKALLNYQKCAFLTKENKMILVESLLLMIAQRILFLLASYTVYRAFGLNEHSVFVVMAFQVCVCFGSDLMPTPGGVMVNEGLTLVVNEILYGSTLALSGMLMLRCFNFYFLVIISAIFYCLFRFPKKRVATEKISVPSKNV